MSKALGKFDDTVDDMILHFEDVWFEDVDQETLDNEFKNDSTVQVDNTEDL